MSVRISQPTATVFLQVLAMHMQQSPYLGSGWYPQPFCVKIWLWVYKEQVCVFDMQQSADDACCIWILPQH